MFSSNNYPSHLFWRTVNNFISRKLNNCNNVPNKDTSNLSLLILPYFGSASDSFKIKFFRLCKQFNCNSRLVFTSFKVSRYFNLKDACCVALNANIIYKFTCSVNKGCYIGKTKRHLFTRISEHRNSPSAILDHRLSCSCTCNIEDFSVIDRAKSPLELSIRETLHIKYRKPSINNTLAHNGKSFFLNVF